MPFVPLVYRNIKSQPYDWQQKRKRFLIISGIWVGVFLILTIVFIGLFGSQVSYLNGQNCLSACGTIELYGSYTQSCGSQKCCVPGQPSSVYYQSFQTCLNDYSEQIYLVVFVIFLLYTLYEGIVLIVLFCRASVFQAPPPEVIDSLGHQFIGMAPNINVVVNTTAKNGDPNTSFDPLSSANNFNSTQNSQAGKPVTFAPNNTFNTNPNTVTFAPNNTFNTNPNTVNFGSYNPPNVDNPNPTYYANTGNNYNTPSGNTENYQAPPTPNVTVTIGDEDK